MKVFSAFVLALLLAAQIAAPAAAQRSDQTLGAGLSGDQWAECFAVFTGMATILLAHGGPMPAQGAEDGAGSGVKAAPGPADRFLALSEEAGLRWLASQGAERDKTGLMSDLEQAVDQVIKTAVARHDFVDYLQRTSDRCIAAVNS